MRLFGTNKNKKKWHYASGFLLLLVIGFVFPHLAHADGNPVVSTLTLPFRALIYYGIFVPIGWFASMAVTIFGWVVDPAVYGPDGLFNKASIYDMWKFVRDFLNLFFILVLLYTAFTIVFQVASNYKKTLLSIVLAALFVNFSFPITRVVIDAGNVPMYYFINQMMGPSGNSIESAKGSLGTVLSASKIQTMLMPTGFDLYIGDTSMTKLVIAVVFLFLFAMALLVLAIMLVVRLSALLLLVVFSPVGFAASIIPGLKKYSDMWWDKLIQYVLFGPAAMLMLYITTRFFEEIGKDRTLQGINAATQANAALGNGADYASAVLFSLTIIMLWMTIGIANAFSVAGAGVVTDKAKRFSKWAGRKTYNNTLTRGVGSGLKTRAENNKVLKFATPKYWADSSKKNEELIAARVGGGRAGYNRTVENQHNKKVAEEEKKMEETRTSDTQLRAMIASPNTQDKATLEAAVRLLSKRGGFQDSAQLTQALAAVDVANVGNPTAQAEKRAEVIRKADKELFRDASSLVGALSHLTGDTKSMIQLTDKVDAKAFDGMTTAQYNGLAADPIFKDKLDQKLKREGHAKIMIDADIVGAPAGPGGVPPARAPLTRQAAYDKYLGGMSAEDLGKVKGIHGGAGRSADAELVAYVTDQVHTGNWSPKEHADAYSKLSADQKAAWRAAGIQP